MADHHIVGGDAEAGRYLRGLALLVGLVGLVGGGEDRSCGLERTGEDPAIGDHHRRPVAGRIAGIGSDACLDLGAADESLAAGLGGAEVGFGGDPGETGLGEVLDQRCRGPQWQEVAGRAAQVRPADPPRLLGGRVRRR
jgi:hypothetical protein